MLGGFMKNGILKWSLLSFVLALVWAGCSPYFVPADKEVLVEGGSFDMGSGKEGEQPIHSVTLDSFYMCIYEVTQTWWTEVMGDNPPKNKVDFILEVSPVESVSWYNVIEFCNQLSKRKGLNPCHVIDRVNEDLDNANLEDDRKWLVTCDFTKNGYRLPTEAEWEYAARGGKHKSPYLYSGSDKIEEVAWYKSGIHIIQIGMMEPNTLGIYDMSGSVEEW